jgi:restriction endonuclease
MQDDVHHGSELERLRARMKMEIPSYDSLTVTEKKAVLTDQAAANHPQPVDYGLTYDALDRNNLRTTAELKYKEESSSWRFLLAIWLLVYSLIFAVVASHLRGTVGQFVLLFFLGLIVVGGAILIYICPILWAVVRACIAAYERIHPSAGLLGYRRALSLHKLYVAAEREAKQAAYEAEQAALKLKRSYWERLNGYQFEIATAEVLQRHQFNPSVTPGSADGGVDIEVTRNGLKGVVQCKAHVACVGPHVVRDLYGVIHHSGANFGIIVSRGGFSRGAIDFARDKPILFLDISDLIAMQEGRDVLASAFARSET